MSVSLCVCVCVCVSWHGLFLSLNASSVHVIKRLQRINPHTDSHTYTHRRREREAEHRRDCYNYAERNVYKGFDIGIWQPQFWSILVNCSQGVSQAVCESNHESTVWGSLKLFHGASDTEPPSFSCSYTKHLTLVLVQGGAGIAPPVSSYLSTRTDLQHCCWALISSSVTRLWISRRRRD